MTSATATPLDATPVTGAPAPRAVTSGRAAEFFATGGGTFLVLPALWLLRAWTGLDAAELAVGFVMYHAALVVNDPHFAVTYVLFYRDVRGRALGAALPPALRARYLVAGFLVPLALVAWGVAALASRSGAALGWLIQLMFLLVGWHYVKQGFGALVVLSARRGHRFDAAERAALLAHAYAGWAYAWASPADPGRLLEEKGVVYSSFAHPPGLEGATALVFFATLLPVAWTLTRRWRTGSRLPPAAPLAGFLVTVWIWTVYSSADPLLRYVIPALHSVQYLYFVWLLRRNEAREAEGAPRFDLPVRVRLGLLALTSVGLGWLLLRGGPSFLDVVFAGEIAAPEPAPGALGPTPILAAVTAIVNLHHYVMDAVIWRRDAPGTRYLLA